MGLEMDTFEMMPTLEVDIGEEQLKILIECCQKYDMSAVRIDLTKEFSPFSEINKQRINGIREVLEMKSIEIFLDVPYPGQKYYLKFSAKNQRILSGERYRLYSDVNFSRGEGGCFFVNNKIFYDNLKQGETIHFYPENNQFEVLAIADNYVEIAFLKDFQYQYVINIFKNNDYYFRNVSADGHKEIIKFIERTGIQSLFLSFLSSSFDLYEVKKGFLINEMNCDVIPKLENNDGKYVIEDLFSINRSACIGRPNLKLTLQERFASNYLEILEISKLYKQRIWIEIGDQLKEGITESLLIDLYFAQYYGVEKIILPAGLKAEQMPEILELLKEKE